MLRGIVEKRERTRAHSSRYSAIRMKSTSWWSPEISPRARVPRKKFKGRMHNSAHWPAISKASSRKNVHASLAKSTTRSGRCSLPRKWIFRFCPERLEASRKSRRRRGCRRRSRPSLGCWIAGFSRSGRLSATCSQRCLKRWDFSRGSTGRCWSLGNERVFRLPWSWHLQSRYWSHRTSLLSSALCRSRLRISLDMQTRLQQSLNSKRSPPRSG